jgi:hypothetical protein
MPEPTAPGPRTPTAVERELQYLEKEFLHPGTSPPEPSSPPAPPAEAGARFRAADPSRALDRQLDALRGMYADQKEASVRENFSYITHRALHLIDGVRASEFGETRICGRDEILAHLLPESLPGTLTSSGDR